MTIQTREFRRTNEKGEGDFRKKALARGSWEFSKKVPAEEVEQGGRGKKRGTFLGKAGFDASLRNQILSCAIDIEQHKGE